jgi:UDP-N-acetylmuramate dehydrogenase
MTDLDALARALAASLEGRVETNRALGPLTTYRVGGPAGVYAEPAHAADLGALADLLAAQGGRVPVLLLGRGSNLVVSDRGWPGIAVRLGPGFAWIRPGDRPGAVVAGAGTPLPTLANWAARRSLEGLEFMVAIPGSVGGAVRMNAGAHEGAVGDHLETVRVFDLEHAAVVARAAADLGLGYRRSSLRAGDVVLEASFALAPGDPDAIRARMEAYRRHRSETQPGALQNAGSVFKNPPGDTAGRLVEAAGLKGMRVGGARVATLHANFFIASDGATAQDVYDLVRAVRARVRKTFGVELEPEIRFAGEFEDRDRELEPAVR